MALSRFSALFHVALPVAIAFAPSTKAWGQTLSLPDTQSPVDEEADRRLHPPENDNGVLRGEPIVERARPDFDSVGTRLGSFDIIPAAALRGSYDDNIYRTPTDTKGDFIAELAPALIARSNWNSDALDFDAGGDFARHAEHPREDWNDWRLRGNGRLDIQQDSFLAAGGSVEGLHEDRSSPEDQFAIDPTHYIVTRGDLGGYWRVGDIETRLYGIVQNFRYDNNRSTFGIIDNSDRNRTQSDVVLRSGYEYLPRSEVFVRLAYDNRSYQTFIDEYGFRRGGDGESAAIGVDLDLGNLVTAEAYVGFLHQTYIDPRFSGLDTPIFEGRIFWEPTSLITAELKASRTAQETIIDGAASYIETAAQFEAQYELLRNLNVVADLAYIKSDFQQISRIDESFNERLAVSYLLNRVLKIRLSDSHTNRNSNVPSATYGQNTVVIQIDAAY